MIRRNITDLLENANKTCTLEYEPATHRLHIRKGSKLVGSCYMDDFFDIDGNRFNIDI